MNSEVMQKRIELYDMIHTHSTHTICDDNPVRTMVHLLAGYINTDGYTATVFASTLFV